ncbi:NHLP family bacteriocin export ABC transporter peptidase/permease/ATPase subunit [Massilia sp. TWP1-3-3]|uniref:NHLP family bacteriocin export ABC transporter peptidase/permease/ATPase subunit n=1 Tax=Massilia sp. TWP1-3-3 TaxID=2804573 RepID=UPI003CEDDECA
MLAATRRLFGHAWWRPGRAGPAGRRVNTPSILQMDALECGAASLGMILAYYKKYIPLEELRTACGVSRNGSKAVNIQNAARSYGLESKGYKLEMSGLRKLALPAIIFWNFNHFLVLEGFSNDKVYLNDPASGKRVLSHVDFDKAFTGVAMTFAPGPTFTPSGQPPSLLRGLRKRLAGSAQDVSFLLLLGVALIIPGMVIPTFTALFIDNILVQEKLSWAMPLLVGIALTAVLLSALLGMQRHFLLKLETKIALSTSAKFFAHVLRLPVSFYFQRSAGDIGSRVGISDSLATILSEDLLYGLLSLLSALFFAVIMLFYDVGLTCIILAVAALNVALLRAVAARRKALNQRLAMDRSKVIGTSMNGLALIETLKASGAEADFFSRWSGYQTKLMNSMQETGRTTTYLEMLPSFLTVINSALVLGIGGLRVMSGDMTIGMLVAFQSLVASFVAPINTLVALGGKLQAFQGDMDRLDDVMRNPCDPACDSGATGAPVLHARLEGGLELRNVTFGYSRLDPPLITHFNLSLKAGQRIALVGASGCGKSTISKLVSGLYQPWEGEILFDGKPRSAWDKQQMLNSVAMVDQDISLFSGTIRDNLTMWDSTVQQTTLVQAAKDASIHDVISNRPGGYESEVGEGGFNFSGGQRQRLEIARALATNPRLLILDEATSALDPLTEKLVDDAFRRRGCSCLIVAHRLSAVRDSDEILFLDQGTILERGTHEELMRLNGSYARMISNE